jgi:hypothetical protein
VWRHGDAVTSREPVQSETFSCPSPAINRTTVKPVLMNGCIQQISTIKLVILVS